VRLLPIREVEPLLLYCWDGLSYGEIAEVLGIPVGTVRSRISRLRQRLSSVVDAEGPAGDMPTDRMGQSHG
jgi:RNA polymerase sigma-70 factor (ECF subfamily)